MLQQYEITTTASELMKRCFWVLGMESSSKGRRVEMVLNKISEFLENHPRGKEYAHIPQSNFFEPISNADKARGGLIQRIDQIHKFCFQVIETEALENAL